MARKSTTRSSAASSDRVLCIDIGGIGLKAAVVNTKGKFLSAHERIDTPRPCPPIVLVRALRELVAPLRPFDHVSIGFPGFVKNGVVLTAPHLDTKVWAGYTLEKAMAKALVKPVRLLNDADVQGLAAIKGRGLELVCTLGTGFGTAWFRDGELMPHMDLAHMAIHRKHDFDDYIGEGARKKIGDHKWNKRIAKIIPMLVSVFNFDTLYFGGGNSRRVNVKLPQNVKLVSNDAGIIGGAFVWHPKGSARR